MRGPWPPSLWHVRVCMWGFNEDHFSELEHFSVEEHTVVRRKSLLFTLSYTQRLRHTTRLPFNDIHGHLYSCEPSTGGLLLSILNLLSLVSTERKKYSLRAFWWPIWLSHMRISPECVIYSKHQSKHILLKEYPTNFQLKSDVKIYSTLM